MAATRLRNYAELSVDPRIRMDETTHTYTVRGHEGVRFRSVTELARAVGTPFDPDFIAACLKRKCPDKYGALEHADIVEQLRAKAADSQEQGKRFHELIDSIHNRFVRGEELKLADEMLTMHKQWHAWMTGRDRKKGSLEKTLLLTELMVFNIDYAVAGTIDALVLVGNEVWLVDWKTNKSIGGDTLKEYEVQLQLYDYILRHSYGFQVERLMLVNVNPGRQRARQIPVLRWRTDAQLEAIMRGEGEAASEEDRLLALYDN